LMRESQLSVEEQRTIRHQFHQVGVDLEQWMRLAASVLARTAESAAVVTSPRTELCHLKHVELIAIHEDPEWNRHNRISHPGTFNANPLCAAAGVTGLQIIASQPINKTADAAASRLKEGLNRVLRETGTTGFAYGLASLVWVAFGISYDGDLEFCSLPHDTIKKGMGKTEQLKRAMLNEGVDMMGGTHFIVSATHTNREIDQTIEAFDRSVRGMKREGIVG